MILLNFWCVTLLRICLLSLPLNLLLLCFLDVTSIFSTMAMISSVVIRLISFIIFLFLDALSFYVLGAALISALSLCKIVCSACNYSTILLKQYTWVLIGVLTSATAILIFKTMFIECRTRASSGELIKSSKVFEIGWFRDGVRF